MGGYKQTPRILRELFLEESDLAGTSPITSSAIIEDKLDYAIELLEWLVEREKIRELNNIIEEYKTMTGVDLRIKKP